MDRRTVLSGVGAAFAGLAGCTSSSGGAPTDTSSESATPTGSPTPPSPQVTDQSFEPRSNCGEPGAATISVDGDTVVVEGCIVGKNGCQRPVLELATYDDQRDELRVRVATEAPSDTEACTQALVDLPYRVRVTFVDGLPGTTTVIHDGVNGQQQAGQAETGGD
jgi:hypothetical protein